MIYSNRTESIAFKKELDNWQRSYPNIKIIYTVTDCQPKNKECIPGKITKDLAGEVMSDLHKRIFFLFGPPKMINAMNDLCLEAGCKKEMINKETFIGY